jgi:MFS family permease
MLVVGAGAAAGVLIGGPLGDRLLARGRLKGRIQVPAFTAVATVLFFIPALITHSWISALPYIILAAAMLSAQNPPIDAARLDIVPAHLWGRAEGIRTFVRTGAQALAPLLFGAVSDLLSGSHPYSGLRWTFVIMLLPLSASALFLFRAMRTYPGDVATAGVISEAIAAEEFPTP